MRDLYLMSVAHSPHVRVAKYVLEIFIFKLLNALVNRNEISVIWMQFKLITNLFLKRTFRGEIYFYVKYFLACEVFIFWFRYAPMFTHWLIFHNFHDIIPRECSLHTRNSIGFKKIYERSLISDMNYLLIMKHMMYVIYAYAPIECTFVYWS